MIPQIFGIGSRIFVANILRMAASPTILHLEQQAAKADAIIGLITKQVCIMCNVYNIFVHGGNLFYFFNNLGYNINLMLFFLHVSDNKKFVGNFNN